MCPIDRGKEPSSLRILMVGGLVAWHPQAGGGQIIASKMGETLAGAGHEVHYIATAPEQSQRKVEWGETSYIPGAPGLLGSIPCSIRLARSRYINEYDIVHVHWANETAGYCLAYALSKRMGLNPRLVMSIYAPKAYAFPRSLGEIVTTLSSHSADLIFSLSAFSKRDISRAYRLPFTKIAVTYAGVDSSFTARNNLRPRKDDSPFVLLYSGRLNGRREQKGIDILLKSLPLVLRQHDVVLSIVGTGSRLDRYKALAGELNLNNRVRFCGFVEHDHMPSQYAGADLFVLPSRRESFGLVLAEAMACGLPVVSTTVGAIPEVVEDGVTGLLVPPDDPRALADAINTLLSDPQRRKAMGIAGGERVEKYFTWDKVADRVLEGYHKIL